MTDAMPEADGTPIPASIPVTLRVREDAPWTEWNLTLLPGGIRFVRDNEAVEIRDADLNGIAQSHSGVTLYSSAGTTASVRGGEELTRVAGILVARICSMREVTRPLRAFGAKKGRPGQEHDRFFASLLLARRQAESAGDFASRIAGFDTAQIRAQLDETIHTLAQSRFPKSPPEFRALSEALNQEMSPVFAALEQLAASSAAALKSSDSDRFSRFRTWFSDVDALFAAADQCWLDVLSVLDEARNDGTPFWARILRKTLGREAGGGQR